MRKITFQLGLMRLWNLTLAIGLWHPHLGIAYDFVAMKSVSVNAMPSPSQTLIMSPQGDRTIRTGKPSGGESTSGEGCGCCKFQEAPCIRVCGHNYDTEWLEGHRSCWPGYTGAYTWTFKNGSGQNNSGGSCYKIVAVVTSEDDPEVRQKIYNGESDDPQAWNYQEGVYGLGANGCVCWDGEGPLPPRVVPNPGDGQF